MLQTQQRQNAPPQEQKDEQHDVSDQYLSEQNAPASIRISPDARTLVVTEKSTDRLVVYALGLNGVPGATAVISSPGRTPCGADFDPSGRYIVAEASVAPGRQATTDGSTLSSISLSGLVATVLTRSVATTETAAATSRIRKSR